MEQIILTDIQRNVFSIVAKNATIRRLFYLTGGTALSGWHLHHRQSDDLDFFTDHDVDLSYITGVVKHITDELHIASARYEHLYDRNIFYLPTNPELKIEFTKYPFPSLDKKTTYNRFFIDSLLDIGVNKLFTIFDRNDPKDFVDLYFILKHVPLKKLISGVKKKFDFIITPLTLGSELMKVRHMAAFPKLTISVEEKDIVQYFEHLIRSLKKDIIA